METQPDDSLLQIWDKINQGILGLPCSFAQHRHLNLHGLMLVLASRS